VACFVNTGPCRGARDFLVVYFLLSNSTSLLGVHDKLLCLSLTLSPMLSICVSIYLSPSSWYRLVLPAHTHLVLLGLALRSHLAASCMDICPGPGRRHPHPILPYFLFYMHACMSAYTCFSPPCFLVRSDLPWAGGALDLFCFISELCVAALRSSACGVYICCWQRIGSSSIQRESVWYLHVANSSFICMHDVYNMMQQSVV
jgi:hypothetical protein